MSSSSSTTPIFVRPTTKQGQGQGQNAPLPSLATMNKNFARRVNSLRTFALPGGVEGGEGKREEEETEEAEQGESEGEDEMMEREGCEGGSEGGERRRRRRGLSSRHLHARVLKEPKLTIKLRCLQDGGLGRGGRADRSLLKGGVGGRERCDSLATTGEGEEGGERERDGAAGALAEMGEEEAVVWAAGVLMGMRGGG
ncbi:hypothetical protein BDU57DRAFT_526719 [Ampelomyces quisqualis]|uniref:Uncharacterized protein n=1 Tax=Ampelomyces quisqualis TaxID=50730 RepID=A0A6A5R5I2_AMPQU|nr:hypothetical protein BDU57DRAFT_526719 [Ampelomyces quisqualis]